MDVKKVSMSCMVSPGPEMEPDKKVRFPMLY